MSGIILTPYDGAILGPIAKVLGYLMEGIFFVLDKIGIPNVGLSIILFTIVIYLLLMPLTIKQQKFSKLSAKMNPELQAIQAKYKNRKDNDSMMAKSQEMMMVYQKYKINPVSGCVVALIQIPLFFAFLAAINEVPAIFEGTLFGMHLGMTPWKGLSQGEYIYIVLIFLIVATTYISFKNTMKSGQNNEMMKQMNFMFMFMIISISIASFSLPTAIAFYWIVVNGFAVIQNIIIKKILDKEEQRDKKVIEVKHKEKKSSRKK